MALVEISNLTFSYADRPVLKALSFLLEAGERVALLGANGSGKSTLLLNLIGILRGQGEIRVDELLLQEQTLSAIRARVGLVFQDPDDQLFSPTVREDVAFGPSYQGLDPEQVEQRVNQALRAVGMIEFADRSPHQLSGGQKKQVALATVLSMQPQVLVLDEPTSSLDARARRGLLNLLTELPQAMLIATHDLALAEELCSRVLVLNEGELVMDAPTQDLLRHRNLLEQYGLVA